MRRTCLLSLCYIPASLKTPSFGFFFFRTSLYSRSLTDLHLKLCFHTKPQAQRRPCWPTPGIGGKKKPGWFRSSLCGKRASKASWNDEIVSFQRTDTVFTPSHSLPLVPKHRSGVKIMKEKETGRKAKLTQSISAIISSTPPTPAPAGIPGTGA